MDVWSEDNASRRVILNTRHCCMTIWLNFYCYSMSHISTPALTSAEVIFTEPMSSLGISAIVERMWSLTAVSRGESTHVLREKIRVARCLASGAGFGGTNSLATSTHCPLGAAALVGGPPSAPMLAFSCAVDRGLKKASS